MEETNKTAKANAQEEESKRSEDVLMNSNESDTEVPMELEEVLDTLPEDKRHRVVCAMMKQTSYRGPLPHPEILKEYEKILPGAAERILVMAESQQKHRMSMEETIIKSQTGQSKNGQKWGGCLTIFFGVLSLGFALLDFPTLAGVILTTTIIALSVIFVLNKRPNSEKTNENNDESLDR